MLKLVVLDCRQLPYRDPEARREADRRRYYRNLGRPYPYTSSNGTSLDPSSENSAASSGPVKQERIAGFDRNGRKSPLAFLRGHVGEILAVALGIGIGAGVNLATYKYQVGAGEQIRKLLGSREEARPLTERERSDLSMENLLRYSEEVMARAAESA